MINLLPPKEKETLLKEKQKSQVFILGITIFASLLFLILILFSIKVNLKNEVNSQKTTLEKEQKIFKMSEMQNLEKEIKDLNITLSKLDSFYQEKFYLTDILRELSETLPPGLYLKRISFNAESQEISLSGFSPTREILSEFKRNLEKEKIFKDVYFPPSNWLYSTNIDFFATFKILK